MDEDRVKEIVNAMRFFGGKIMYVFPIYPQHLLMIAENACFDRGASFRRFQNPIV